MEPYPGQEPQAQEPSDVMPASPPAVGGDLAQPQFAQPQTPVAQPTSVSYAPPGEYAPAAGQYPLGWEPYAAPPGQYPPPPGIYAAPGQPWAAPGYPAPPGYPPYGWPAAGGAPYGYVPPPAASAPQAGGKQHLGRIILFSALGATLVIASVAALLVATMGRGGPRDFRDPLSGDAPGWQTSNQCYSFAESFHADSRAGPNTVVCLSPAGTFTNFDMHVSAGLLAGSNEYGYGLVFRQASVGNFYVFAIDSREHAWFAKVTNGAPQRLSDLWQIPPLLQGIRFQDTLRVVARGSGFIFYVNGAVVGTATDASYTDGAVGVFSGGLVDVGFTNFEVSGTP